MNKKKDKQKNAFESALSDLGLRYWEYDIVSKRLYRSKLIQDSVGLSEYKDNVPESYVEEGTIHPDYVQDYLNFYHDLQKGIPGRLVFQSKFGDGNWGWLDISYKIIYDDDGNPKMAIGVGGDITKQRDIETKYIQTQEEKKHLELLIDTVLHADFDYMSFIYGDTKEFISYYSNQKRETKKQSNYPDRLLEMLEKMELENTSSVINAVQWDKIISFLDKEDIYTVYLTMKLDGKTKRKQLSFYYIDRENNYLCAAIKDITEIYEFERASTLELEKANAAKTDFLARMSHDIRTPINTIIGLTSLTLDEPGLSDTVVSNLNQLRMSSEFLLGLVNDVLDMAKIEQGKVELHYEPYSYQDFIVTLKSMFGPLCKKNGLNFEFEEVDGSITILTDKIRLNQIFLNLLSNAVKYTPEGGTIRFHIENVICKNGKVACDFIISDTGIGMSKEFQKNMFESFTQENNEITAKLQGSGLGLAIVKSLIELMNGTIQVESEIGKGTTITIHLVFEIDLGKRNNTTINDMTVTETQNQLYCILKNKKVLLVEDHNINAEIEKKLLEKMDIRVELAENGQIAIDKLKAFPDGYFDAVLMDIRMPVMNGLQATGIIRELPMNKTRNVPIIAMTANAYDEDRKRCKDAGMNAHIAKPVEPKLIYKVLGECIQKSDGKNLTV